MSEESNGFSLIDSPPHQQLQQFVGAWEGLTRTWFEPGKLADESPTIASIESVFEGQFISLAYEGTLVGHRMLGRAIYGYDQDRKRYEGSWIDNIHMGTGMMFCAGEAIDNGFFLLGYYTDHNSSQEWGWRVEFRVLGHDQIRITTYNITPDGEEALAIDTTYDRRG